jgi:hypothetical protein
MVSIVACRILSIVSAASAERPEVCGVEGVGSFSIIEVIILAGRSVSQPKMSATACSSKKKARIGPDGSRSKRWSGPVSFCGDLMSHCGPGCDQGSQTVHEEDRYAKGAAPVPGGAQRGSIRRGLNLIGLIYPGDGVYPGRIRSHDLRDPRKRYNRPLSLIIIGGLFLLFPVWNYLSICVQAGYPYWRPLYVLQRIDLFVLVLMGLSFAVGVGLLMVKRWGWRLLFVFAAMLVGYNIWAIVSLPDYWLNIVYLLQTVLGLGAAVYFLKPDMSAPYVKMYPRGWRFERRQPVQQKVQINGRTFQTRDLSSVVSMWTGPTAIWRPARK